jgi:hypothetical protein
MKTTFRHLIPEYRELDRRWRRSGLSLGEAARYRALFDQLASLLAGLGPRDDRRQFLRVPRPVAVAFTFRGEPAVGVALDFGSGGLCLSTDAGLTVGDVVLIDRVTFARDAYEIDVSAEVAWLAAPGRPAGVGLAFRADSQGARERVDKVFYRVLDAYLRLTDLEPFHALTK